MSDPPWQFLRDLRNALLAVAVVGAVLFAATGVWPPMVAVESGSMAPNLRTGDLVVVTAPDRYAGADSDANGVVTAAAADGHTQFGRPGDVIVFTPPSRTGSPIIHRARFHVTAGENWYRRANRSALPAGVDSCRDLRYCPAPHAGYITRGDANEQYDQVSRPPVRADWIRAKGAVRVPLLGWVRLVLSGQAPPTAPLWAGAGSLPVATPDSGPNADPGTVPAPDLNSDSDPAASTPGLPDAAAAPSD
jgi:signal peptidase